MMPPTRRQLISGAVALCFMSISVFKFKKFDERLFVTGVVRNFCPEIKIKNNDLNDFSSDFIRIYDFDFTTISNKLRYFMISNSAISSNHILSDVLFIRSPVQRFFHELVVTVFIKSTNFHEVGGTGIVEYFGIQEFKVPGACSNIFARFDPN
jgi:hypothetical protein